VFCAFLWEGQLHAAQHVERRFSFEYQRHDAQALHVGRYLLGKVRKVVNEQGSQLRSVMDDVFDQRSQRRTSWCLRWTDLEGSSGPIARRLAGNWGLFVGEVIDRVLEGRKSVALRGSGPQIQTKQSKRQGRFAQASLCFKLKKKDCFSDVNLLAYPNRNFPVYPASGNSCSVATVPVTNKKASVKVQNHAVMGGCIAISQAEIVVVGTPKQDDTLIESILQSATLIASSEKKHGRTSASS